MTGEFCSSSRAYFSISTDFSWGFFLPSTAPLTNTTTCIKTAELLKALAGHRCWYILVQILQLLIHSYKINMHIHTMSAERTSHEKCPSPARSTCSWPVYLCRPSLDRPSARSCWWTLSSAVRHQTTWEEWRLTDASASLSSAERERKAKKNKYVKRNSHFTSKVRNKQICGHWIGVWV